MQIQHCSTEITQGKLELRVTGNHQYIYIILSPVKNVFLKEAKIVNEGTKFIFRDIAQQVGEQAEKLFS